MTTWLLKKSEDAEPFLVMEAFTKFSTPTAIEDGPGAEGGMSMKGTAEKLAKGGLRASVAAIASRLGRDVIVEAEGEEPTLGDLIKELRGEQKPEEGEEEIDLMADGEIAKADEDKRIVFGWAYVTHDTEGNVNIDKSGDFIDAVDEIEKSAYDFVLHSRSSDADHTNVKGGTLVESIVFTPEKIEKMGIPANTVPYGWWLGFKIEDDATWDRVKKGELRAFSIHGKGTRSKVAD